MALKSTIRLPISELPEVTGTEDELYYELRTLYNALNNLAISIDLGTGQALSSDVEKQGFINAKNLQNSLLGNLTKVYKKFDEEMYKGMVVTLNSSGNAIKCDRGLGGGTSVNSYPIGVVNSEYVPNGGYGEIKLAGLVEMYQTDLIPGKNYEIGATPGLVVASYPFLQTNAYFKKVGIAVTNNTLILFTEKYTGISINDF